ncbi:hypothetical protein L596_020753 [Steinernema carpocapsae]|uniref:Uncharacterized protein n=1 Tax=Steinernema carpocapsae TaxID=34508 RepID=A0A4U5MUP1_STECR|nr:hypothetical protein L596_020753 [Steinernema carpocapsae]
MFKPKPEMPQETSPSLLFPLFERSSLEPTISAARRLRRKNHIENLPKATRNPPRHYSRRTCLVCVWDANVRDAKVRDANVLSPFELQVASLQTRKTHFGSYG